MKYRHLLAGLCAASLLALPAQSALAQEGDKDAPAKTAAIEPQVKSRDLSGTFGGVRVPYTATIAETVLKSDKGEAEAVIVTTSYVRSPRDASRPVFFIYNGGPG